MNRNIIGVDIGGTTIKIGFIDQQGNIIKKWEIATNKISADDIIKDIWSSIQTELEKELLTEHDFTGIGASSPGFIDEENGMVYEAFNVGWEKYDFFNQFRKHTRVPVFLGNDANMAALGENWKGAGNQAKNMMMITVGTGVGSGVIANGELLTGENGMAGEIGHMTVDIHGHRCSCGRIGCVETICSATGIVRQARHLIREEPESKLAQISKKKGAVTAKDVFELAKTGDSGSANKAVYRRMARAFHRECSDDYKS